MALVDIIDQNTINDVVASNQSSQDMDKDAFLKLLVTQMQYQDPLEPLKNEEFIAQLAQFTTLEQMTNMNQSFETMLESQQVTQATALVGQTVAFIDSESGELYTGIAESVTIYKGVPAIQVGEYSVELGDIVGLGQISTSSVLSDSAYLIGKDVTYIDAQGDKQTGLVKSVVIQYGIPTLIVGDDDVEVGLSSITAVSIAS